MKKVFFLVFAGLAVCSTFLEAQTGSLEIQAVTAGTAEITGVDVNQTAEIPAGRNLSVGEFKVGSYRVVMHYEGGYTEERTVELRQSRTVRLMFGYRRITGSLEILTVTAGTLEITGANVNQTAELSAGGSFPIENINEGSYRAVMRYENGKTEEKTVTVRDSQTARLKFNYSPREPRPPERLNSLGVSVGATLPAPVFAGGIQGTIAPWRGSFFDLGVDMGLGSGKRNIDYYSLYPYARYAFFLPFTKGGGWYIGAGAGCMLAKMTFYNIKVENENKVYKAEETGVNFAADVSTGVIFRSGITLSYTLRTDFATVNNKLAVGYSYRFKQKEK